MKGRLVNMKKDIRNAAMLVLTILLLTAPVIAGHKKTEPKESELLNTVLNSEMTMTDADENTNSLIAVAPEYADSVVTAKNGVSVPDIMSERIMKSDYRKLEIQRGNERIVKYVSGPGIVINGVDVPRDSFYAEGNYLNNELYYVICPECFHNCGFEPNYSIVLTLYDEACLAGNHTYTILCDELEIHTTWEIDMYDESSNTYWCTVKQKGPFSGTSDIFSVYVKGERKNTMPAPGTIHGTVLVEYDPKNRYWTSLGYNRDDYRYLIDSGYGTGIGRLPYKQDILMRELEE